MMLQTDPDDFVIATGQDWSVADFLRVACEKAKRKPEVYVSHKYYRPAEVNHLCGDPSKAYEKLGWEPRTTFEELVEEMVMEAGNAEGVHRI